MFIAEIRLPPYNSLPDMYIPLQNKIIVYTFNYMLIVYLPLMYLAFAGVVARFPNTHICNSIEKV